MKICAPPAGISRTHAVFTLAAAAALSLFSLQAGAHELPLGNGRVSDSPKAGFVYSCQQRFNPNAPAANVDGPWISGTSYDPSQKPMVLGSVSWNARLELRKEGDRRVVRSNALPATPTGNFPIRRDDPAHRYDRNPNSINEMNIVYDMPARPLVAANAGCVPMGMIGITVTNTALFNALDARGRDAPAHEVQDSCDGHPERNGLYHFHNLSPCIEDTRSEVSGHSDLLGYALDGFGIYGKFGTAGRELSNKDLDACHGHTHWVSWDGERREIYHYHMTAEYPYTLGCFRGEPATMPKSLAAGGPQNDPPSGARTRDPGARLADAAAKLGVSVDQLMRAVGPPPPDFQRASQILGIPAARIRQAMGRR